MHITLQGRPSARIHIGPASQMCMWRQVRPLICYGPSHAPIPAEQVKQAEAIAEADRQRLAKEAEAARAAEAARVEAEAAARAAENARQATKEGNVGQEQQQQQQQEEHQAGTAEPPPQADGGPEVGGLHNAARPLGWVVFRDELAVL